MDIRTIFPQESGRTRRNPLLESTAMPQRKLFRFLLFAVLGLIAGFLALAIAVPIEQQIPAALIALFSPGLKLAELITPETGKSFAWSFGWFLPNSSRLRQLAGYGWNSGGGMNERRNKDN